jgi:hypothetical protein
MDSFGDSIQGIPDLVFAACIAARVKGLQAKITEGMRILVNGHRGAHPKFSQMKFLLSCCRHG